MNLNIPAKAHTHTIQIFRKCNWNFIQPIMHGLEIQRVFTYCCCCWCHPSGQYFFNLSSIYIYAINFEINEKEIATFLIVQKGFVCGFQALKVNRFHSLLMKGSGTHKKFPFELLERLKYYEKLYLNYNVFRSLTVQICDKWVKEKLLNQ